MKKITLLLVITFTFLFSNTSWGEWSYFAESSTGTKFYFDKDRVRKSGKYLYVWELHDLKRPFAEKWFSGKISDSEATKVISDNFYKLCAKWNKNNNPYWDANP